MHTPETNPVLHMLAHAHTYNNVTNNKRIIKLTILITKITLMLILVVIIIIIIINMIDITISSSMLMTI